MNANGLDGVASQMQAAADQYNAEAAELEAAAAALRDKARRLEQAMAVLSRRPRKANDARANWSDEDMVELRAAWAVGWSALASIAARRGIHTQSVYIVGRRAGWPKIRESRGGAA